MKTFNDFQKISEQFKTFKTPEELSKKHNVSLSQIKSQLKKGSKVEAEHTKDKKLANVIASQHLDELPDYYTRLKKAEKVNEETKSGDSSLRDWFTKSRASDGTPGWVQLGGKYSGKPCAKQPGQTTKPKCGSSKMKASLSDEEEKTAFLRKNRQDPNPDRKGSAKMVATEEKDACYSKVKSRYSVWPSAYASGALVKCRKVGAKNWGNKSKVTEEYTRLQANGNTYSILLNWRGVYRMIQVFVSGVTRPTKAEITHEVDKIYPGANVLNYRPSLKDPTKPYFIFTK